MGILPLGEVSTANSTELYTLELLQLPLKIYRGLLLSQFLT